MYTHSTTGTIHISFENTDGFAHIRPEISVPQLKIFLADGEIIVYNISIPRGKGKYMKRNDYVQYLNPYTRKFIICQIEEIYGDGHVLLYAVDTNEAFLVNTWELLSY